MEVGLTQLPAALFAATLRTLVRTLSQSTGRPSELLARINRLMFEELSSVERLRLLGLLNEKGWPRFLH